MSIGVPGVYEAQGTYSPIPSSDMPPVARALDGTLGWLLETPTLDPSLQRGPDDPAQRDADGPGLLAIAPSMSWPAAFRSFIEHPEPRRHIRSATAGYLDLGQFVVPVSDGGILVHFLSDQQWALHWLLYLGRDGAEAVVVTPEPFGFDDGDIEPARRGLDLDDAADGVTVCSESFEEFLYRFWIENELFFQLAVDGRAPERLAAELRAYATAYPRGSAP